VPDVGQHSQKHPIGRQHETLAGGRRHDRKTQRQQQNAAGCRISVSRDECCSRSKKRGANAGVPTSGWVVTRYQPFVTDRRSPTPFLSTNDRVCRSHEHSSFHHNRRHYGAGKSTKIRSGLAERPFRYAGHERARRPRFPHDEIGKRFREILTRMVNRNATADRSRCCSWRSRCEMIETVFATGSRRGGKPSSRIAFLLATWSIKVHTKPSRIPPGSLATLPTSRLELLWQMGRSRLRAGCAPI